MSTSFAKKASYRVIHVLKCPKYASETQSAFICSKLTIETLEQGVKYVQR